MNRFGKKKVAIHPGDSFKKRGNFSQKYSESEVLTSIVRGLAAIGCRKETLIEDVVDNDYGLWVDEDDSFYPIIEKGTSIKEASVFDKVFQLGKYVDVKCEFEDQTTVTIKIYQRNLNGLDQLGTIFIEDAGGKKYRIFMYVNPVQGKLVVAMYDRVQKHWIEIPLNQSQYNIKKVQQK